MRTFPQFRIYIVPILCHKKGIVSSQGDISECKKIFKKLCSGLKKNKFQIKLETQTSYNSEKNSPNELFRISLVRQYWRDGASIFKFNSGNICTSFCWNCIQNEKGKNLILSLFENSVSLEGSRFFISHSWFIFCSFHFSLVCLLLALNLTLYKIYFPFGKTSPCFI